MKLLIATVLFAAGCATTSTGSVSTARTSGASLPLAGVETKASPYFPTLISKARLPSVDRRSHALRAEATELAARVRICVAPDGRVASVDVDKSSGVTAYDRLLAADIATWRYAGYTAPAHLKVCQRATVTYLVR
jgi:TonB family protein